MVGERVVNFNTRTMILHWEREVVKMSLLWTLHF